MLPFQSSIRRATARPTALRRRLTSFDTLRQPPPQPLPSPRLPGRHLPVATLAPEKTMATIAYENAITALLVVDPYDDFISEGGKIWNRIRSVAEANDCVPAAGPERGAQRRGFASSTRCIVDIVRATTKPGSTLHLSRGQRGQGRPSNTARGAAKSVPSSSLSQARWSPRSTTGAPEVTVYRTGKSKEGPGLCPKCRNTIPAPLFHSKARLLSCSPRTERDPLRAGREPREQLPASV